MTDRKTRRLFLAVLVGLCAGLVTRGLVSEKERLLAEGMARSQRALDELNMLHLDVDRMRAEMLAALKLPTPEKQVIKWAEAS